MLETYGQHHLGVVVLGRPVPGPSSNALLKLDDDLMARIATLITSLGLLRAFPTHSPKVFGGAPHTSPTQHLVFPVPGHDTLLSTSHGLDGNICMSFSRTHHPGMNDILPGKARSVFWMNFCTDVRMARSPVSFLRTHTLVLQVTTSPDHTLVAVATNHGAFIMATAHVHRAANPIATWQCLETTAARSVSFNPTSDSVAIGMYKPRTVASNQYRRTDASQLRAHHGTRYGPVRHVLSRPQDHVLPDQAQEWRPADATEGYVVVVNGITITHNQSDCHQNLPYVVATRGRVFYGGARHTPGFIHHAGRHIISLSWGTQGALQLREVATGRELHVEDHAEPTALHVSSDGLSFMTCTAPTNSGHALPDSALRHWSVTEPSTGSAPSTWTVTGSAWQRDASDPNRPITSRRNITLLSVAFDGGVFALAYDHGHPQAFNMSDIVLTPRVTFRQESAVTCMDLKQPNGDRLVTGHADGWLRVWCTRTGWLWHVLKTNEACTSVRCHPEPGVDSIASGHETGAVRVWGTRTRGTTDAQTHELAALSCTRADQVNPPGSMRHVQGRTHAALTNVELRSWGSTPRHHTT